MANSVDLSDPGILSANVSWWMIMDIENGNFDFLYIEVSDDDFVTFTQVASFFGQDMLDPWIEYSYSLSSMIGSNNVKVRFHFSSDGGYEVDGCYIDDFSIITSNSDEAPPEILFDAPFAYEGTLADYLIEAEILDVSGVTSAEISYTVEGVAQTNVPGINTGGDNWEFTIPAQDPGSQVDFQIEAVDASPNANSAISDTASYIAGNYIGYDNAVVDYFLIIDEPGGTSVVFTLEDPRQIVTALIRNYTDQSQPPNDTMLVHIWAEGANGPGVDLITPIAIMPEVNLVNTRAWTRVDLRPYSAQLSNVIGNVFVGFTVPNGTVLTTISQPGIANHSYQTNNGTTWNSTTDDFHYRIITGEAQPNPWPRPQNVTAEVENLNDVHIDWDEPNTKFGGPTSVKNVLEGYNVFRDGIEIDFVAYPVTEYYDMDLNPDTYEYYVTAVYDDGESVPSSIVSVTIDPISVELTAFLEGPFFGGLMSMTPLLNIYGYIPLAQPYSDAPWNYQGTENVGYIPNYNVVDWVLVELRETPGDSSTATSGTIIGQRAGFILKDGSIVDINGNSPLQFSMGVTQNLYAVVYHRNHIGIMSAYPLTNTGSVFSYNFSTGADQVYGGIRAHKELAAGIWGMFAGNALPNASINNIDKNDVWIIEQGNFGYYNGDMNMNGQIDATDEQLFWEPNAGTGTQVPE